MATGNSLIICGPEGKLGDAPQGGVVLRRTTFKVDPARPELRSGEMRPDPFEWLPRLGATSISGEIGFEVVPGAHDFIMAGILHNEWDDKELKAGADFVPRSMYLEHHTLGSAVRYTGVMMEKVSMTFAPNELVKATASFLALERDTVNPADLSSVESAPETLAAANWDGVFMVDDKVSEIMTALTIDITRNINLHHVLGKKYPVGAHAAKFAVSGSMTVRPSKADWWERFHDESWMSLDVTIYGVPDKHSYTFKLPRLLLTSAPEDLSDPDDLLIELPWTAGLGTAGDGVPMIIERTN